LVELKSDKQFGFYDNKICFYKYLVLFGSKKYHKNCWGPQCASANGLFDALIMALSSAPRPRVEIMRLMRIVRAGRRPALRDVGETPAFRPPPLAGMPARNSFNCAVF